jgi:hypothetical protein
VAVKLWLPAASADVLNVATSAVLRMLVPKAVLPSKKVTLPVAVPAPGATGATVAVSVTDCPKLEGSGDAVNAVIVEAWITVSVLFTKLTL